MCFLRCVNFLPDGFGALEERVALCINLLPDGLVLALPVLHLGWPCMEDRVALCNLNMLLHFEPPQAVALSNINILLHFATSAFGCTLQHQHSVALCNIIHHDGALYKIIHHDAALYRICCTLQHQQSVALCNIIHHDGALYKIIHHDAALYSIFHHYVALWPEAWEARVALDNNRPWQGLEQQMLVP